jgi:sporulation protein YlmC with PRC-barrel domain
MPTLSPVNLQYEVIKTYLGYEIVSPRGEHLGTLWNFAIDETTGEVAYAIFQSAEKFYGFLWDEFHLREENTLEIMMTGELLDELPGLDPVQCPPWRGHRVRLLEESSLD